MEFALILPVFALLLFSLIDFGLLFGGWNAMRSGTQAGARDASLNYTDGTCPTSAAPNAMVCTILDRIGTPTGVKASTISVQLGLPEDASTGTEGQVGDPVQVCVTATISPSTGATDPFLGGRSLRSFSELRLEQTPGNWAASFLGISLTC